MSARATRASARRGAGLDEVADRLHSLAIHLLRRAWVHDAEMGLSRARSSALSVLVYRGAMTLTELAAAEHVAVATMSKLTVALEADGWIERQPHPRDARALRLRATPAGRAAIEHGRKRRVEALCEVLAPLGAGDVATVEQAIALLEAAVQPPHAAGARR